jgi:hypothetical protein
MMVEQLEMAECEPAHKKEILKQKPKITLQTVLYHMFSGNSLSQRKRQV